MSAMFKQILPKPIHKPPIEKEQPPQAVKRHRTVRANACETCRAKKSRCDGVKPSCGHCVKRCLDCQYKPDRSKSIQQELQEHRELLRLLRAVPEHDLTDIVRRLRTASDPSAVLASVKGSMHGRQQPSAVKTARAIIPPGPSELEFELMTRHRMTYQTFHPVDFGSISPELLPGFIGHPQSNTPEVMLSHDRLDMDSAEDDPLSRRSSIATNGSDPLVGPQHAKFCDERLQKLQIDYWTTVPINDDVAAGAISHYLEVDHPIYGFFDADLFLDDLVAHKLQFCSAFLVNALLCYACQPYSVIDETASSLSDAFRRETVTLWRSERLSDSILNVAALMLFGCSCQVQLCDVPVMDILDDARRMAGRLQLFDTQQATPDPLDPNDPDIHWKRAVAHVAWGAYTNLTLTTFYCVLKPIKTPPAFFIPHEWPVNGPSQKVHGVFAALCKFVTIVQEVALVYFAQRLNPNLSTTGAPLAFAESKFQKLLNYTDTLEQIWPRGACSSPQLMSFYIIIHSTIMNIFLRFIPNLGASHLGQPVDRRGSIKAIVRASTNQLKRLLLDFRLQKHRKPPNSFIMIGLLHVSNAMLSDAVTFRKEVVEAGYNRLAIQDYDPEWHFYFILCITICWDLIPSYPIFESVARGLLAMALRDGTMSTGEANRMVAAKNARQHRNTAVRRSAFGVFSLDLGLAAISPEDAQVKVMAERFEEITVLNEFTKGGDYEDCSSSS